MAFQKTQWPAFQESAQRQLQQPQEGMQLLLWRYPYFEKHISWQLTSDTVFRRVWDRPLDFLMVSDPLEGIRRSHEAKPTIEYTSLALELIDRKNLWLTLAQVQIPLKTPSTLALDGTQHGIHSAGNFRLTWNPLPEGWEPLQAWLDETLEWLEQLQ